jgi:hypothetical protein
MDAMTSGARTRSTSPARRLSLVLAVLAGVLAMHALSPSGTPSAGQHLMAAARAAAGHHAAPAHAPAGTCRHLTDAGHGGTAMDHAGGTYAAGGTATSYVPPALLPAPTASGAPAAAALTRPVARPVDGRAPSDLSELQLLRI